MAESDVAAAKAKADQAYKEYQKYESEGIRLVAQIRKANMKFMAAHPGQKPTYQDLEEYGFSATDREAYNNAVRKVQTYGDQWRAANSEYEKVSRENASDGDKIINSYADKYESKKTSSSIMLDRKTEYDQHGDQTTETRYYNKDRKTTTIETREVLGDGSGIVFHTREVAEDGEILHASSKNVRTKDLQRQIEKEREKQTRERQTKDAKWKDLEGQKGKDVGQRNRTTVKQDQQKKEEERKQKEAQKAADKARKAEEKAKEKERREQEHQKRVEQRAQNKKEYEDALAKYKDERKKAKEEETRKRAQEATERHNEFARQHNELVKKGTDQGAAAYKKINDYTYTEYEKWKEQEANGGYKGTSAQAKQELKDSISDIWNASTKDARDELSGAYKGVSGSVDALKNARQTMQDLYNGKVLEDGVGALSNSALNIQVAAMAVKDKDGMVELQKAILTQKLADRMVLDNITDAVSNQMYSFQVAGANIKYAYLAQKAYVSAYIKQTFANPQFVANVTKVVATKVDNYIEALTNEQVAKIGTKIDNVFTKVDKKLDRITYKATTTLDKLSKINILESMNDKIDKLTSLNGLQKKLDKSPVGFLLSPLVGAVSSVGGLAVKGLFASTGITGVVAHVQAKIFNLQKGIVKAKAWVTQKVQMVKDYVNQMKEKAKAAVKAFADKIVGDIKSKIKNALTGAFGGKGVSF